MAAGDCPRPSILGDYAYCVGVPLAPGSMAACAEFLPTSSADVGCNVREHSSAIRKAFIGRLWYVGSLLPSGMQLVDGRRSWLSRPGGER